MDERVAIVTAVFGGFDEIRPQAEQDIDCEWICFTDEPMAVPKPWTARIDRHHGAHPRFAAKRFKMLPPVGNRRVIWIDANTEITSESFAREALGVVRDGLAAFKHPRRDCIFDEGIASLGAESQNGKYADQAIDDQLFSYRAEGHPEHGGLFACGTLAWDRSDHLARVIGLRWLEECARWTDQDQLSLPVICRRLKASPGTFRHSQIERRYSSNGYLGNRWQILHPHLN